MELVGTNTVREADVRPARADGTCFYCRAPLGAQHVQGCVIRSRTVVVRVEIDVVIAVPQDWTSESIDFHHNEGSWCSNNMLEQLGEWAAADDDCRRPACSCGAMTVTYQREADENDDATLPSVVSA